MTFECYCGGDFLSHYNVFVAARACLLLGGRLCPSQMPKLNN